jgi:hypothetical protein
VAKITYKAGHETTLSNVSRKPDATTSFIKYFGILEINSS